MNSKRIEILELLEAELATFKREILEEAGWTKVIHPRLHTVLWVKKEGKRSYVCDDIDTALIWELFE